MNLYLPKPELIARVHLGKQVEQWLSHYKESDYTVIRWLSLDKKKTQFELTYFESFDDGDEHFRDVHEFSVIDPEDNPYGTTHFFDSVEEALDFATSQYGALVDRFIAANMIHEEYSNYLNTRGV